MKKKFLVIFVLLVLFGGYIVLFQGVRISDGRVWIKTSAYLLQSADIFETDSLETAMLLKKESFEFQMTPEITVRFLQGSAHQRPVIKDGDVIYSPTVHGDIEIRGSFYKTNMIVDSTIVSDVIPEFTREEFLEKLQAEAQKMLPAGRTVVIGKHLKDVLDKHDGIRFSFPGDKPDPYASHMFGSIPRPQPE